jgi:hypothetical protein
VLLISAAAVLSLHAHYAAPAVSTAAALVHVYCMCVYQCTLSLLAVSVCPVAVCAVICSAVLFVAHYVICLLHLVISKVVHTYTQYELLEGTNKCALSVHSAAITAEGVARK